jgi:hypothetical protein
MSSSSGDGGSDSSGQADWMRSGLNADAPSSVGEAPGRGRKLFATFPGVVTAAATVVVALGVGLVVTTVYGGSDGRNGSAQGPPTSKTTATSAPSFTAGAPSPGLAPGQIDPRRVLAALADMPGDDEVLPLMSSCADADARACASLGDALVLRCYQGDGISCDLLYEISTVGSAYETYAATCGGRVDVSSAGTCRQVDMSLPPQPPPR